MGLGRFGGGAAAARFLSERGARVLATDLRSSAELPEARAALAGLDVEWVLGEHRPSDFDSAEWVVANPAVSARHPLLQRARAAGARVTTEVELFLAELPCRAVAITGTQGKSSTTTFVAQLLEAAGLRVHAGGNLGGSLLDHLADIHAADTVVLELSSYQLEHLASPPLAARGLAAAAVLNVLEDHLERHGTRAEYGAAKGRIFELLAPDGLALVPDGEAMVASWPLPAGADVWRLDPRHTPSHGPPRPGVLGIWDGPDGPAFWLGERPIASLDALQLPRFQRPNALAALALAQHLGAPSEALARALPSLAPPPHRLADLGTVRGRRVYDNGVSTTPDSTVAALEALGHIGTLVVGGQAKQLDYGVLARAVRARCRRVVAFGASGPQLAAWLASPGLEVRVVAGVAEAARMALEFTPEGEIVVFSPACASFDAHPNFKERALAFAAALKLAPA